MATLSRRGRGSAHADYTWPGYVDALASLLMVLIFLLAMYTVGQFALTDALSGRDNAIDRLNRQLSGLAADLGLERKAADDLRKSLADLTLQLDRARADRDRTAGAFAAAEMRTGEAGDERDRIAALLRLAEERARAAAADADAARRQAASDLDKQRQDAATELERLRRLSAAELERIKKENATEIERQKLELTRLAAALAAADLEKGRLFSDLTEEQKLSAEQKAAVIRLTAELTALKQELARLAAVLDASDKRDKEQQAQILDLGQRLNRALASKVEELARYRSEFFGRLREALGGRSDIQIVGDRFVFQSEVLFDSGSAELKPEGEYQLARVAATLAQIMGRIPPDVSWVLQVDGHTDAIPIRTAQFPSNWELSSARAIAVVRFFHDAGIPWNRLAATGYAEFQPLAPGVDVQSRAKNRRIEIKITNR